jgi:hypothetical protein
LRAVGLYLQRGGVGFYPTSGSPFVHLDTGNVRHWPAIAADDMPRLMSEGQSLHSAAEATEVASNRRQPAVVAKLGSPTPAAASRPAPVVTLAAQIEKPSAVPTPQSKPKPQGATYEVASAESRPVQLRPAQAASLVNRPSVSANDIINQRDYWRSLEADPAIAPQAATAAQAANVPQASPSIPRPPAPIPSSAPTLVASADPQATASVPAGASGSATASLAPWPLPERGDPRAAGALAYADPTAPVMAQSRPAPMGTAMGRPAAPPDTTVAVKRVGDRPSVISSPPAPTAAVATAASAGKTGDHFNDPWLRALIVAPSAQEFLSASNFGAPDYRSLAPFMHKPAATVVMTFASDPQPGMTTKKFSGTAIVFVSTVTFGLRTASLR